MRKHLCSGAATVCGAAPNFTFIYSSQMLWGEWEYERDMALVRQPGFSTDTESRLMSNLCWLMLNFLVCLEAVCGMLTFWAFFL